MIETSPFCGTVQWMQDEGGDGEVPVADLLDALEFPRGVVSGWMDHLDAFFARHGGARRYGVLCRLVAETRSALASSISDGPERR
jgi:hypothetical protein